MAEPPIHDYQIADSDGVDGIVFALSSRFHLGDEGEKVVRRTYYDTFDWRLYQAGAVFYEEKSSSGHWLVWRYLEAGRAKEMQRLDGKVPRYAGEFAPGLMRELVTPEISMRVLLPQVEVRSCVRLLIQYDQEEKTVLRVALEEHEARPPNKGKYAPLEATAQVVPIRGYPKPFERMSACLSSELKMQPLEREQMEAALAAIGRKPLDYSSKLNFKLQPQSRADAVARLIHLHLLAIMEVNLPGTRADLDSEFLHDFRVAVRRARSALTQVKEVFPREVLERYKEGFAWVGGVTGPTRDMDVYLLGYEDYRDSLQQQFRGSLEPLHHFLQIHQKSEHQAMVRKLNSPHFHTLIKEWKSYLESPLPEPPAEKNASRPVSEVSAQRIYSMYQRVMKEGTAINSLSPAEDFHELRKSCKKLRYLLEFFQSLYPKNQVRPLIKALKVLLDNLGDFQDLEVQACKLQEYAHLMVKEGEVPADTLLAMGMLVSRLLQSQQQAQEDFSDCFAVFSARKNRSIFKSLFLTGNKREKKV